MSLSISLFNIRAVMSVVIYVLMFSNNYILCTWNVCCPKSGLLFSSAECESRVSSVYANYNKILKYQKVFTDRWSSVFTFLSVNVCEWKKLWAFSFCIAGREVSNFVTVDRCCVAYNFPRPRKENNFVLWLISYAFTMLCIGHIRMFIMNKSQF